LSSPYFQPKIMQTERQGIDLLFFIHVYAQVEMKRQLLAS